MKLHIRFFPSSSTSSTSDFFSLFYLPLLLSFIFFLCAFASCSYYCQSKRRSVVCFQFNMGCYYTNSNVSYCAYMRYGMAHISKQSKKTLLAFVLHINITLIFFSLTVQIVCIIFLNGNHLRAQFCSASLFPYIISISNMYYVLLL